MKKSEKTQQLIDVLKAELESARRNGEIAKIDDLETRIANLETLKTAWEKQGN